MINKYRLTTPTSQFKSDYSEETPPTVRQTINKTFPTAIKSTNRMGLQNPYNGGLRSNTIQPFPSYRNVGNMEQFPTVVPGSPPASTLIPSWTERPDNMEKFPIVVPGEPPQRPIGGSWNEQPAKQGMGRPWGVALPGQSYIQVEGPGNPSWEARHPEMDPSRGANFNQPISSLKPTPSSPPTNTIMNQIQRRI